MKANGKHIDINCVNDAFLSNETLADLLLNSPVQSAVLLNREGITLKINEYGARMLETTPTEIIGKNIYDYFTPSIATELKTRVQQVFETGEMMRYQEECNGCFFNNVIYPIRSDADKVELVSIFTHDITELKNVEQALREAEERYRELFENSSDIVYIHDLNGNILAINKLAEKTIGYNRYEALSMNVRDILTFDTWPIMEKLIKSKAIKNQSVSAELKIITKDCRTVDVDVSCRLIYENGKPWAIQGTARDITQRKRMEEKLRYISLHDSLTGLYNRAYFTEEISRVSCGRYEPVGLIICDVDGLKLINDNLGHDLGDILIVQAAKVIQSCFRECDVVARIGGDEFAVIVPNSSEKLMRELVDRIEENSILHNQLPSSIPLSLSAGWALRVHPEESINDLFKEADNMMYTKKRLKGERFAEQYLRPYLSQIKDDIHPC